MYQQPHLAHRDAMLIVDTLRQQLEANGQDATVAVVDAHGELLALLRTDGSSLPAINNAIHKAFTAAREGIESGELGARARAEGWSLTNFGDSALYRLGRRRADPGGWGDRGRGRRQRVAGSARC